MPKGFTVSSVNFVMTQSFVWLLILTLTVVSAGQCPKRAIPGFSGSQHTAPCYLYERFPTQFVTAERMCRLSGGHLASIGDGFINTFVAHGGNEAFLIMDMAPPSSFWIGAQNLVDQAIWRWVDDQPWNHTQWDKNEPNNGTMNRCSAMKLIDGKWEALDCFDRKPYVCELGYIDVDVNKTTTTTTPTTQKWLTTSDITNEPEWMTTLETLQTTQAAKTTVVTTNMPKTSTKLTTIKTTTKPTTRQTSTSTSTTTTTVTSTTELSTTTETSIEMEAVCPDGWNAFTEDEGGDNMCYNFFPSSGWLNDQHYCQSLNATLASIHSDSDFLRENIYKTKQTPGKIDMSIGLKEEFEGDDRWLDKSPYDYENWMEGYPQDAKEGEPLRCVTYFTDTENFDPKYGQWRHINCNTIQARMACATEVIFVPVEPDEILHSRRRRLIRGDRLKH
ncbi:C-type lectin domain-containing protein [Aphelenchoides besseyi]|nr:C-type lectin domain-containing protein [Aphelenchoides besseyi]